MALLILRTQNLIHTPSLLLRNTTQELTASLDLALAHISAAGAINLKEKTSRPIVLSDPEFSSEEKPVDATLDKVTVKLFLHAHVTVAALDEVLDFIWSNLKLERLDLFMLSVPFADDLENDEEGLTEQFLAQYLPLWKKLETAVKAKQILSLGVCGFSKKQLQQFIGIVEIAPSVDHVNLDTCCYLPKDLVEYAKANHIELLTHNDNSEILPQASLLELLNKHQVGLASSCTSVDWVLRFSSMQPQYGIAVNKSYAVAINLAL